MPAARPHAAAWLGLVLLGAAVLPGGCAAPLAGGATGPALRVTDRVCAPRAPARVLAAPPPARAMPEIDLAAHGFSPTAIGIAEVIGARELLRQMVALEAAAAGEARAVRWLLLRQAVTDRILLAMADISSTLAEIDCEGERGDALRERLLKAENRRSRRLGLATIMLGALTAAASGGLSLAGSSAGDIAGIVGGAAEGTVAATLLFGESSGELRNGRNLMREVWEAPDEARLIPRTVWRFLNRRPTGDPAAPTQAELLRAEWRADERLGAPGSDTERARIALLFGEGGSFTVEELELRDASLDLLETTIAAMSQELRVLLDELAARPAPPLLLRAAPGR